MPYSSRLLENGSDRTLENGVIRALEIVPKPSQKCRQTLSEDVACSWTDRTGITKPDVTGPLPATRPA